MAKPILLVTRRLPQAVEARAVRDYEARLNPEDVPRSGADILRLADGAAAIKAKGDAGLNSLVVDPYANQQVRVIDFAYGFMEHSGEHYGQLVVYYRVSGLVPPESRPKKQM